MAQILLTSQRYLSNRSSIIVLPYLCARTGMALRLSIRPEYFTVAQERQKAASHEHGE